MFLIALWVIFNCCIVLERIAEIVAGWILGITDSLDGVMILVLLVVLLFIDATVLAITLTPIFLPLVRQLGGAPVHFGAGFIVGASIGNFTPQLQARCMPCARS